MLVKDCAIKLHKAAHENTTTSGTHSLASRVHIMHTRRRPILLPRQQLHDEFADKKDHNNATRKKLQHHSRHLNFTWDNSLFEMLHFAYLFKCFFTAF